MSPERITLEKLKEWIREFGGTIINEECDDEVVVYEDRCTSGPETNRRSKNYRVVVAERAPNSFLLSSAYGSSREFDSRPCSRRTCNEMEWKDPGAQITEQNDLIYIQATFLAHEEDERHNKLAFFDCYMKVRRYHIKLDNFLGNWRNEQE